MRRPASPAPSLERPEASRIKANLGKIANQLGFAKFGVAPALPAKHGDRFLKWVEDGCAGQMAWLEKNTDHRVDPRLVFPEARSVIVLGLNYYTGEPEVIASRPGRFARFAWGEDYHRVVEEKLRDFTAYLSELGSFSRAYIDTGPVLERDFASEAGLGWNGKSTVQIDRQLGTWWFLAVVLSDLELPADSPESDHCGKCTRCIDCCPTGAITDTRRVDARRCISYLTIEHRGSIPLEFRKAIGDRVFGCDDCLAVCPWNRFAQASSESRIQAREFVTNWNLRDFLTLGDDAFRIQFQHSPIKRAKRQGFLRNVCVALGNVGTARDLSALELASREEDPVIREHAEWARGEIETR